MQASIISDARNLAELFHARLARTPGRTALLRKRQGLWKHVTWAHVERSVHACASELLSRGLKAGDRVAILSQTRPEWYYVDQAVLSIGAASVPIYPSVIAEDVFYVLRDSGARAIFVENSLQREKVVALRSRLPALEFIFSFESDDPDSFDTWLAARPRTEKVEKLHEWRALAAKIQPSDLATIVYTSGTSGVPKGVPLTHAHFVAQVEAAAKHFSAGPSDTTLLYLPVAHIFGRIELMQSTSLGWINAYAEGLGSIMENLAEVRPTYLLSVPRVYEKVYAATLGRSLSAWSQTALRLAVTQSLRYRTYEQSGRKAPFWLDAAFRAADAAVFRHVRARFGKRLRCAISGGAPLARPVAEFFLAAGMPIFEGYGLTESTGPVTANNPEAYRLGSVGKPLPNCEVRLAEDGEILLRGPQLFTGYYGSSEYARQQTREAFDEAGFFKTGDLGRFDEAGYLYITGRKKDLIVTSGGKNIAPQKIEGVFKGDPLFSQVILLGDGRPFIAALFTLNPNEARILAERKGIRFASFEELINDARFAELLRERVSALNTKLSPFEAVKRYRLLPRELSVEAGELTPSLKVRRLFCAEKFANLAEEIYA